MVLYSGEVIDFGSKSTVLGCIEEIWGYIYRCMGANSCSDIPELELSKNKHKL